MDNYVIFLNPSYYLLNDEDKGHWLFFVDNDGLKYLHSSDKGLNWSKEKSVYDGKIKSFTLTFDSQKNIHIIIFDINNNLLHLKKRSKSWEKTIVTTGSEDKKYSLFTLLPGKEILHLFYLTVDLNNKEWGTYHKIYRGKKWEKEIVMEKGSGPGNNYLTAYPGLDERIHTIQLISKDNDHFLYYRSLDPDTLSWTSPVQVSPRSKGNYYPCLLEDENKDLHLLWTLFDGTEFKLFYRKKSFGGWPSGGWKEPEILCRKNSTAPPFPFLWQIENKLSALWFQDNHLDSINSLDMGFKWSPLKEQNISNGYLVGYYQNYHRDNFQRGHYLIAREFPPRSFLPPLNSNIPLSTDNSSGWTEEALQEEEKEENNLERNLEDLKGCSTRLLNHAVHLEEDREYLKKILERKQKEFSWFYKKAEDQVNELNETISSKDSKLIKLEKQLENTIKIINERVREERTQSKKEKDILKIEINKLKQENIHLKEKIKELKGSTESLKNHLKDREKILNNLQMELNQLQQEIYEDKNWWNKIKEILNKYEIKKK